MTMEKRLRSIILIASAAVTLFVSRLRAETDATLPTSQPGSTETVNRDRFTLFNPVPRELLRELQTDRPDQTEGPFTVDAGHLQSELDLVNYTYDRIQPHQQHVTSQSILVAPTDFRVGILSNLEFDLIAAPFIWQRNFDRDTRQSDERTGFGDVVLRAKVNFFGNDEGKVALGLIPYIKLPTHQAHLGNPYVEGGVILPITFKLPASFELDAMTEVDVLHHDQPGGFHAQWTNSVVLHRDLIKDRLNAYVEYFVSVSREPHAGPYETADAGLLLALTPNVQLDCGINFGTTRRAPDYNPFVGLSVRF